MDARFEACNFVLQTLVQSTTWWKYYVENIKMIRERSKDVGIQDTKMRFHKKIRKHDERSIVVIKACKWLLYTVSQWFSYMSCFYRSAFTGLDTELIYE